MGWITNIFGTRPPTRKELDAEQRERLQKALDGAHVFGPKPSESFNDRLEAERTRWEHYVFVRLYGQIYLELPKAAKEVYENKEIGEPVFWQDQEGDQFASFPNAQFYQPKEISAHSALYAAGDVYAKYQIRCIDDFGGFFDKLHPQVAVTAGGKYSRKNEENRAARREAV